MASDTKEKHKDVKDSMQKERRSFLKKTAYAAPALIVLGQLARPTTAKAAGLESGPPPAPGNGRPW